MIAVVPPLWAILIVLLIVGAAALFVVVCGLLWIWGRGEEPEEVGGFTIERAITTQDEINGLRNLTREIVSRRIFLPITGDPRELVWAQTVLPAWNRRRRPYDWAHRVGILNPDGHLITHRGELLGKTEWPRG